MLAVFNSTWDWTAVGTLALAIVTGISLVFGWKSLRQGQREVEEAHRPVVVPVASQRFVFLDAKVKIEARPHYRHARGQQQLIVAVENIGSGPALHVNASVQMLDPVEDVLIDPSAPQTPAITAGIGHGQLIPLEIRVHGWGSGYPNIPRFELTLNYEDVAGKAWITKARYVPDRERYEDVTISLQAD